MPAMKNNYWMKLWFDILVDPKMGTLSDRLWRRTIELFLIAGKSGKDGLLPSLAEMAWMVKTTERALESDMRKLVPLSILHQDKNGAWWVTNFRKRNEKVTDSKRVADFRNRQRNENKDSSLTANANNVANEHTNDNTNASVTNRYQEEQRNRGTELNPSSPPFDILSANSFAIYEKLFGQLTSKSSELIIGLENEYSEFAVLQAMKEAYFNGAKRISYVTAILRNWRAENKLPVEETGDEGGRWITEPSGAERWVSNG